MEPSPNGNIINMEKMLTLHNVNKTFREPGSKPLAVLRGVNFEINTGEFFVLVGPSGSGKSTLLRIMSGLEKSYEGKVIWAESQAAAKVAFIFQQFALLPWLTVFQNVELGLLNKKFSKKERAGIVEYEMRQFGLEKFAQAHPRELSGGMQQRVGLARALAINPKVLFMDEPFSELDSFTAQELRQELLKIWRERKLTIVLVSHIVEEALELADRVAIFTSRPATIKDIVINHLPRPRNKRSPEFFELADKLYSLIRP